MTDTISREYKACKPQSSCQRGVNKNDWWEGNGREASLLYLKQEKSTSYHLGTMGRLACRYQCDAYAITTTVLESEHLTWIESCSADAMMLGTRKALLEGLVQLQVYKRRVDPSKSRLTRTFKMAERFESSGQRGMEVSCFIGHCSRGP